jgi:two-component system, NtrC family, nitrogen regulation sensor histidine kinase NtrY
MKTRWSWTFRLSLGFAALSLPMAGGAAVAVALSRWLVLDPFDVFLLALLLNLPLGLWVLARWLRPQEERLLALRDALDSLATRDFSLRLARRDDDLIGSLARSYNVMADVLQDERSALRERELLLETALERSPLAIVLVNAVGRVIFSNPEARRLFMSGRKLEGFSFFEILDACPAELKALASADGDGLFSVEEDDEIETYHLSRRVFHLNRRQHTLILLRRLTRELDREEARIWKKVIRIISHELNNSLAPISSLAHSAGILLERRSEPEKLRPILTTIEERVAHLKTFLDGYARFARLPAPRKEKASWSTLLEGLRELYPFELEGQPPEVGYFDPAQLQQALINLIKNALEASSEGAAVTVRLLVDSENYVLIQVLDRGHGMSEDAMRRALLPFYSTKAEGVGLGLPLCREIVAGHGGTLRLEARPGGGTVVTCRLPPQ